MFDRLLSCSLHLIVLSLIGGCAVGALLFCYTGLFQVIGERVLPGTGQMVLGVAMGLFVFQLCRYRNELIDI